MVYFSSTTREGMCITGGVQVKCSGDGTAAVKCPLAHIPSQAALERQWVRPWLDPSGTKEHFASGQALEQQNAIAALGDVLQVVTEVEAGQLQGRASLGLRHLPSYTSESDGLVFPATVTG